MTDNKPNLDTWGDFLGQFLKADMVTDVTIPFIPVSVDSLYDDEEKARIIYTGEYDNKKKQWEPNKTNIDILRNMGLTSPSGLIGKKVFFRKTTNFNPQLKKKVPALEVERVE